MFLISTPEEHQSPVLIVPIVILEGNLCKLKKAKGMGPHTPLPVRHDFPGVNQKGTLKYKQPSVYMHKENTTLPTLLCAS